MTYTIYYNFDTIGSRGTEKHRKWRLIKLKNYGVILRTKNGKYSKLVLTMVVEANNKKEAIENAKEMLLGKEQK